MPTVVGVVINGRVELEEKLPEGTRVVVRPEAEQLDEKSIRELAEAAESLDRGEGVESSEVLARLTARRKQSAHAK